MVQLSNGEKTVVNLTLNAAIYFVGLLYLGFGFWKSAAVAAIVWAVTLVNFERRVFTFVGAVILCVSIAVFLSVIPPPADWQSAFAKSGLGFRVSLQYGAVPGETDKAE